jgi:hypothetical protein
MSRAAARRAQPPTSRRRAAAATTCGGPAAPAAADTLRGAALIAWAEARAAARAGVRRRGVLPLIAPGLFVGDRAAASRPAAAFEAARVAGVVCLAGAPAAAGTLPCHVAHFPDTPDADLLSLLPGATGFMEDVISRGGAVFVHCMGGISRSPAVVAAYFMRYRGLDVGGAMQSTELPK